VAVGHVDPAKAALAREYGERYPTRVDDGSGAAQVMATGEPILVREIALEMIDGADVSEEQAALIRDLEMRSVIVVPLVAPGQPPLGVLTLVMAESGRRFDERDLALAEDLGRRAGVAVENARLYTERSLIASTLQQSLLPEALPQIGGFQLASLYRAAGEQSEVGGDFYDVFPVPSGWVVLVGDVTGRGPRAAALTSLARYTMRTAARLLGDPLAALEQLNTELRERSQPSLVTIACVLLRETPIGTEADIVLAGHPPPYHLREGLPEQVGVFGSPLGAYPAGSWRRETISLEPGDQLVLYTDGVIDTVGQRDRFGEERLARALSGAADAADAVARIDAAVTEFASGPQTDDTAVVAVERVSAVDPTDDPDALVLGGSSPGD
jgi:serine phosphatase RsbU (regulator of sigma subunit)